MHCTRHLLVGGVVLGALALQPSNAGDRFVALQLTHPNPTGSATTVHQRGYIDLDNAFFKSLGTNGRTCDSCHRPEDGWSVTPASLQRRFDATAGLDPIFALNDGSNSPMADVSTIESRRGAFSMLLSKGLIRVGLPIPQQAEFELQLANDPYNYASATELSLFRRPLPATNLRFASTVMWDGRETVLSASQKDCIATPLACYAPVHVNLGNQANGATVGHAQAAQPLTDEQRIEIVDFEIGLFTAQVRDSQAGELAPPVAGGGPRVLNEQEFRVGINDFLVGDFRTGAFDGRVFTLFDAWKNSDRQSFETDQPKETRRSIARGEALFNTRTFSIEGVAGLNDVLGKSSVRGTCSTCHDAPNAGSASVFGTLDIGVSSRSDRTADMPLYVLRNKTTGARIATTDPGRALITGRWSDVNRFKVPTLRALAARAPYFHDGSAADLAQVIDFYNRRFQMQLDPDEAADLATFLRVL